MGNFYDKLKNKIFKTILKEIKKSKSILDIGCGDCALAFYLGKKTKGNIVGVDLNISEIKKQKIPSRIKCIKGNASKLNFPKESFESTVSMYALHEFSNPFKVLEEIFRILKDKSKIVIVDFVKGTLAEKLWQEKYFTPDEIESMLIKAGFKKGKSRFLSKEGPVMLSAIKK